MRALPSFFFGAACDPPRFGLMFVLSASAASPTAASSSSPTGGRYGVDECLAMAKNAAPTLPVLLPVAGFCQAVLPAH